MAQAVATSCRHHWLLGEPRKGVISAVCKRCRATRYYPARLEETDRCYDYQDLAGEGRPLRTPIYDAREES